MTQTSRNFHSAPRKVALFFLLLFLLTAIGDPSMAVTLLLLPG